MRFYRLLCCAVLLAGTLVTLESASARVKLITLPVRQRVEIQLDNPQATLVEEERIVPLVQGSQSSRFFLGEHADRSEHDRVPRHRCRSDGERRRWHGGSGRRPRPGCQGAVGQLSAERIGPGLASCLQRFGLGSGPHQLPAGRTDEELQLSRRGRPRREDADACGSTCGCNNLANEDFDSSELWAGFGPHVPQADRHQRNQGNADGQVRGRARHQRRTPATSAEYGYIDQPKNKLRVPMHLRAEERQAATTWARPRCNRARCDFPGRRARLDGLSRRGLGQVHAAG